MKKEGYEDLKRPNIEIGESPIQGKGLFAKEFIPAGSEIIFPPALPDDTIRALGTEEFHKYLDELRAKGIEWNSISNGDGTHTVSTAPRENDPSNYGNHSCDPNNDGKGHALRDIEAGEEITVDYAQFSDKSWSMPCNCGAANCTGIVRGTV
ncbi:SET domain-containing protein-lysine N-methyltransferase [Candidatus Saccharibacteria bacterium]|nr:SET domain-containing protein-lysine N-methyltransferase [Candidatus Saccharibacteria bacterium]MCB9821275.1 SET domain-containing protein-lysine N-methyltransferase [Candidatus Nomurabacteria bacterium]